MNKFATFFAAPLTAFFMPGVYRDASKKNTGRAILYLAYLAFLSAVLSMALISSVVTPKGDQLFQWIAQNVPPMVWTAEGLSMEKPDIQQPYVLKHPEYGDLAVFNMNQVNVTNANLGRAYIYVTSKKVFFRSSPGTLDSRSVIPEVRPGQQLPQKVRLTGELILKFYQNMKRAVTTIIPVILFIVFFFLYLFWNLLYSLIGLLLNLLRKNKLSYGAIFHLTCFATTTGLTLTWAKLFPPLRSIPWPVILAVLVNITYIFFALKITDRESTKA